VAKDEIINLIKEKFDGEISDKNILDFEPIKNIGEFEINLQFEDKMLQIKLKVTPE